MKVQYFMDQGNAPRNANLRSRKSLYLPLLFSLAIGLCDWKLAVGDELPNEITIATWNVEWFFDHDPGDNRSDLSKKLSAPSEHDWHWKLQQVARVVGEMKPTILALQEIENRDVVYQLTQELKRHHGVSYRIAYIDGYDFFTEQDVAIIYRSGLVEFSRREQTREMWNSKKFHNLQKHIFARFEWGQGEDRQELLLANVHFRSSAEGASIRKKQARLLRTWLEPEMIADANVVVLGDFNTDEEFGRGKKGSEMEILRNTAQPGSRLHDLHQDLKIEHRPTHMIGKQFDRILVSEAMGTDNPEHKDLVFKSIRNYASSVIRRNQDSDHRDNYYQIDANERDVSDHYPIMAEFEIK